MKTVLVALSMFSLCTALFAQPAPAVQGDALKTPVSNLVRLDPAARSNMLAKTGGMIMAPAKGPVLVFLNTQKRVTDNGLSPMADQLRKILRLSITVTDKPSQEPVTEALAALADNNTAAVLVLADVPGYPSLLVAPENRWALVNVAALGDGAALTERTQKEVWRAFGYLMGAAHSNKEGCLLKPVLSAADLDALNAKMLCPEPFMKIMNLAQKLGMTPQRMTTYRKAVEEGWAPAPANDAQRAIWNELKKK
ncbi:MAG TPA: hypothetical protein PKM57_10420 [Kiritimatiellia bacterium]|nr:hypothetical protein [Kiritimatiellia bacterium]HPS07475.1 hypothetical protein [Kiritimatiellia bacterium]